MTNAVPLEDVVQTLVHEVLVLQAELVSTRILASAAFADDPSGYLGAIVADVDAYTLPLSITEQQRDMIRERLEDTRSRWAALHNVMHPGGWRGVRASWTRARWRLKRIFLGASRV